MIAVSLGGWLAASGAGMVAGGAWRALTGRMETVARACHELRGPLTAARLGLQLGASTGDLSPARLRAIDLELGRAALALEDLDGARVRGPACRRVPEPVDLAELVADLVEAWRPCAAAGGAELEPSWTGTTSVVVWGERLRMAQALGNLIANAIEHAGGAIEVRGGVIAGAGVALDGHARAEAEWARVEVIDGGPGLPAPLSDLIGRRRHGRDCRGRGLAIAAAMAASLGGRLVAMPSDRGARLGLELPLVGHPPPDTVNQGPPAAPAADVADAVG